MVKCLSTMQETRVWSLGRGDPMEKEMAIHSSTIAWKIPWMQGPARLQSVGSLSRTWLSDFTFTFHFHALEREMATHSSVLAWRIPGTGEPGGLPSMGSHRVGHDWATSLHSLKHSSGRPKEMWNIRLKIFVGLIVFWKITMDRYQVVICAQTLILLFLHIKFYCFIKV